MAHLTPEQAESLLNLTRFAAEHVRVLSQSDPTIGLAIVALRDIVASSPQPRHHYMQRTSRGEPMGCSDSLVDLLREEPDCKAEIVDRDTCPVCARYRD